MFENAQDKARAEKVLEWTCSLYVLSLLVVLPYMTWKDTAYVLAITLTGYGLEKWKGKKYGASILPLVIAYIATKPFLHFGPHLTDWSWQRYMVLIETGFLGLLFLGVGVNVDSPRNRLLDGPLAAVIAFAGLMGSCLAPHLFRRSFAEGRIAPFLAAVGFVAISALFFCHFSRSASYSREKVPWLPGADYQPIRLCFAVVLAVAVVLTVARSGFAINECSQGWKLVEKGESREAGIRFQNAVIWEPSLASGHYGLAAVSSAAGDWQKARQEVEVAYWCGRRKGEIKFWYEDKDSGLLASGEWNQLARVLSGSEYGPSGLPVLKMAGTEQVYSLGRAFGNIGRHDLSAESLEYCCSRQPDNTEYLFEWGIALCESGDYESSRLHLSRAAEREPDNAEIVFRKGDVEFSLGLFEEAVRSYRKVTRLVPASPLPWVNLGRALTELKRPTEAAVCYMRACGIAPDYLDAYALATKNSRDIPEFSAVVLEPEHKLIAQVLDGVRLTGFNIHFPKNGYDRFSCVVFWGFSEGSHGESPGIIQNDPTALRAGNSLLVMTKKNLLPNSDFEREVFQPDFPVGWSHGVYRIPPFATCRVVQVRDETATRGKCLQIDHRGQEMSSCCASDPIEVVAGQSYLLAGQISTDGGSAYLGCEWFDKRKSSFSYSYVAEQTREVDSPQIFYGVLKAPPGADYCKVLLTNHAASGSVTFDNIAFISFEDVRGPGLR
ncbi:tetratricopeptide repeat protein [Planctomycetota bacterium]